MVDKHTGCNNDAETNRDIYVIVLARSIKSINIKLRDTKHDQRKC